MSDDDCLRQLKAVTAPGRIQLSVPLPAVASLECLEVYRSLPGKRLTSLAKWGSQNVIAKLYLDPGRGEVHWQREIRGANALTDAGIRAPRVLWSGETDIDGVHVVIYEWLENGNSVAELWDSAEDCQRRTYLKQILLTLASHHLAGVAQHDLHLANFFYLQGMIYTLDGADIHIKKEALTPSQSADNIARFWAQLFPHYDSWLDTLLPDYLARNPAVSKIQLPWIHERISYWRRQRRDQFLKKIFRSCSQFECQSVKKRFSIFQRKYDSAEFRKLLSDPDFFLQEGESLKQGKTCTVARVEIGNQYFVIKRYNIKGLKHAIDRCWRPSRASISWRNAFRLKFYGIATPEPAALIEERCGPMRGRAFFITECVDAVDGLSHVAGLSTESSRQLTVNALVKTFERLFKQRISHGDLKATNFLVNSDVGECFLLDLDAMKEHDSMNGFQRAWQRDMERLYRNWPDGHPFRSLLERRLRFLQENVEV